MANAAKESLSNMPALMLLIGLAAVVAIAAVSGHHKKAAPAAPGTPAAAVTVELDRAMPQAVVEQVLSALAHDTSSAHLEELAQRLEPKYPLSAGQLRGKAARLKAAGAPPPLLAASPQAEQPGAVPAATQPSVDASDLQAATVLQAAMRAMVEESDPVVLEGFAESIRTLYPTAATLLLARAHAVRMAAAPPAAAPPAGTAAPAATSTPPQATAGGAPSPAPTAPATSTESHA